MYRISISKVQVIGANNMDLQQIISEDEQYQQLCQEYTQRNRQFLEIVLTLPQEQQTAVFDFLDTTGKLFSRIFEIASDA